MANQTTANLTNSIRTQYLADYVQSAIAQRLYDQFASPIGKDLATLKRGSAIQADFLSSLAISQQTISETADITPTYFRDAKVTLTPTSRANAVVVSEKLLNTVYTDFNASYYKKLGENMMMSIDALAMQAAVQGPLVKSPAARASLDAGTATHRLGKSMFATASTIMVAMKVPDSETPRGRRWIALCHPFAFADLMQDSVITAIGQYQDKSMILNYELGELNGFSIVVNPWAKAFWGAGAANAAAVATTLSADAKALDTTITVAANTNIAVGGRLTVGAIESSTTYQPDTESVIVTNVNGTTITIIGEGENGGLRYDHVSGSNVSNADNVFPVVFGGPESLAKVHDTEVGEYGKIIGPNKSGLAEQFTTLAWKWYGGYGIISNNRALRSEVASSLDA